MELLGYQGTRLFASHGISAPLGRHATSGEDAVDAGIGASVVKAQLQTGGPRQARWRHTSQQPGETRARAEAIRPMEIRDLRARERRVEEASQIEAEYCASVAIDCSAQDGLVILCTPKSAWASVRSRGGPDAIASSLELLHPNSKEEGNG